MRHPHHNPLQLLQVMLYHPGMSIESDIAKWFAENVPGDWFAGAPEVLADDLEVLVIGDLPAAESGEEPDAPGEAAVREFRRSTRAERVEVARRAQDLFGRKVSWGVRAGGNRYLFTGLGAPVMTRLRLPERRLLDTLVDAGVARSRSDALGWCVRLVGTHEADWLNELDEALSAVRKVRAVGPGAKPASA